MTKEMKTKLFEKMLELEHLSEQYCEGKLFDNVDYFSQAEGAYQMLKVLGLEKEYINWAVGK